jgi:hypothetical protein
MSSSIQSGKSFFAAFYQDPKFLEAMNANYTKEKMVESVKKLRDRSINLAALKWGEYQTILTEPGKWPGQTYPMWTKSLADARDSLSKQPNGQSLSPTDPQVPATKCDLADAAIRKCFNSTPPLAMIVNVTSKAADSLDPAKHDLLIEWVEKDGHTTLKFTMVCPYEPPQEKK